MPRPKGEPTIQERLKLSDGRKLKFIAKRLGLKFRDAFNQIAGEKIDDIYRRMKAGERVELTESEVAQS